MILMPHGHLLNGLVWPANRTDLRFAERSWEIGWDAS